MISPKKVFERLTRQARVVVTALASVDSLAVANARHGGGGSANAAAAALWQARHAHHTLAAFARLLLTLVDVAARFAALVPL